jgi:hypothetical protein
MQPQQPQLFILGMPRSGTTLIYQAIVHRLKVAYFTNGVGDNPRAPCVTTWLQTRRHGDYQSDFRSQYGKVHGEVAPREAGSFWGRSFGLHDYVRFEDVPSARVRALRTTIAWIERIHGNAPFVNKNVKHMLRVDALARIFPESRFLVVERDPRDVALSVLRARRSQPHPEQWWSVRPRNYTQLLELPAAEQVAQQLASLHDRLCADVMLLPASRVTVVRYEQFCADPETLIRTLKPLLRNPVEKNPALQPFASSKNDAASDEELALYNHGLLKIMQRKLLSESEPTSHSCAR